MENIIYGFYQSQFGEMVLAQSSKGLCWLGFMVQGYKGNGYERMLNHFKEAVGANPVSLIVPCHRIIQGSGLIGNYGWGVDLKRQILRAEGLEF